MNHTFGVKIYIECETPQIPGETKEMAKVTTENAILSKVKLMFAAQALATFRKGSGKVGERAVFTNYVALDE